jgi:hypothetical protein
MIVAWHRPGRDELLLVRNLWREKCRPADNGTDEQELVPTARSFTARRNYKRAPVPSGTGRSSWSQGMF